VRLGRVRRSGWARVSHGLYRTDGHMADSGVGPRADLHAWQLVLPRSGAFTHLTAAGAYGWWLPPLPADAPVFAGIADSDNRPRREGLVVCRHTQPVPTVSRGGLRLATPGEALLAAGRDLGLLDLVLLVDSALHAGHCDICELRRVSVRRRRGAPALRRALDFVDTRSESPWESVLRVLYRVCDVPVEPQHEVRDRFGALVARGDLWIVGTNRLHEYDGDEHRTPRRQAKDLARDRALRRVGWERYGYTSRDLLLHAVSVLRDADAALGRQHRPQRVRAWHRLLAESLLTAAGTARLRRRWGLINDETGHERPA
jgi:hypothetical protein